MTKSKPENEDGAQHLHRLTLWPDGTESIHGGKKGLRSSTCSWMLLWWWCENEFKPCFLRTSIYGSTARWGNWHTQWLTSNDIRALDYLYTTNHPPYTLHWSCDVQRDVKVCDACFSKTLMQKRCVCKKPHLYERKQFVELFRPQVIQIH